MRAHAQRRLFVAALIAAASTTACKAPTGLPPELASIEVLSGADQQGTAGVALPEPVVARALDVNGDPSVRPVYVTVVSGAGGIAFPGRRGLGDGVTLESPELTDVSVVWTLGPSTGGQTLEVFALRNDGDTVSVTVHATAVETGG